MSLHSSGAIVQAKHDKAVQFGIITMYKSLLYLLCVIIERLEERETSTSFGIYIYYQGLLSYNIFSNRVAILSFLFPSSPAQESKVLL